jgi:hypothetical protein
MEQKLDAWLIHQRKMEVILQDLQMDCDSSVEATLRYRVDSLEKALLPAPRPAHHAHHEPKRHHKGS